jgi:hypothetical protein
MAAENVLTRLVDKIINVADPLPNGLRHASPQQRCPWATQRIAISCSWSSCCECPDEAEKVVPESQGTPEEKKRRGECEDGPCDQRHCAS